MDKLRHWLGRLAFLSVVAALPGLSGCNSKSFALDDGIPNTPPPAVITQSRAAPPPGPVTRLNTGTYPTFQTLTAANEQIEDADYAKSEPRMAALAQARKSGTISEAEYQRRVTSYRKLAADHGADAQANIAAEAAQ
jgi:hypothetical protein